MAEVFDFSRRGRSLRAILVVIAIYIVLLAAIFLIDAVWWMMGLIALVTLPALIDIWRDPDAGVRLASKRLDWYTGKRGGSLDFGEIDYFRFDTRWDFSVRVTAILNSSKKIRLPYEALPPHRDLETALITHGIRVERHHFAVF